jgi:very-short-patch-repair endonuclease
MYRHYKLGTSPMDKRRKPKYDWASIQKDYNEGMTWREVQAKYGVAQASLYKALKRGDFCSRGHSEANYVRAKKYGWRLHSEESKKKISERRLKFLYENPDRVPYVVNHSSNESYPEKIFRNALCAAKIEGWVAKYRAGIYEYDFAFPEHKLDIEIDGGTHILEKVKRIDARRDEWSESQGWKVIRFSAKKVKPTAVSISHWDSESRYSPFIPDIQILPLLSS